MTHNLASRRAQGEEGVALALALVFLVIVGVLVFFVLGYAQTSIRSSQRLDEQRRALYGVDSGVRAAVRYVQNDGTKQRGSQTGGAQGCAFTAPDLDAQNVTVTCAPSATSGLPLGTSSAPGFAILTMAPFHGLAPTSGCKNVNDELGLVQVQSDKLLKVTGDVYVNSDADSDTWSGGCPNTGAAEHIQVSGNVRQAESCHDIDVVGAFTHLCDTALVGNPPNLANKYPAAPDPAIANPVSWAPNINSAPPTQAVPTCPADSSLISFAPGTYTNVAGLNLLTGGACPNKLLYFAPGDYYFNFGSSGTAPWTLNDPTVRIVGGTPNGVVSGGGADVGPLTLAATNPPAPTTGGSIPPPPGTGFATPTNALGINGSCTPATNCSSSGTFSGSGEVRWITLGGYQMAGNQQIPAGATSIRVQARVVHVETGTSSQFQGIDVLVRDATDTNTLCSAPVTRSTSVADDLVPAAPLTCLDANMLNTGNFRIRYQITHTVGGGGTAISTALDGIELKVTYSAARVPWDPANPATVTPTNPELPGACVRDGDYGFSPSSGVQWVFGGESRILLRSGKLELCPSYSSTHQEIVLFGVKNPNGGGGGGGNATLRASNAAGSGWNGSGGTTINGSCVPATNCSTTDFTGQNTTTRTIGLTNYGPALNIPAGSTNIGVTARIAHSETGVGGASNSTAATRINNQTIVLRNASGAAWSCTIGGITDAAALGTQSIPVGCGALTIDNLNAGIRADYSVTYQCASSCGGSTYRESLDGIEFDVTWTPPASGGGPALAQESGCIVKVPYYNPLDHSPAYSGACALLQVASNAGGGSSPRVVALWGTVYAPEAPLDVPVDILTVPVFNRGVVARILMLGYNLAADASVPITTTPITQNVPLNRRMTFTSTIAGRPTKVVTDVEICDTACDASHPAGTAKIWSWKVSR